MIQINFSRTKTSVLGLFVNLKRAFDSIDHELLWFKLLKIGLNAKTVRILKNTCTEPYLRVRTNGVLSHIINITEGVLQGISATQSAVKKAKIAMRAVVSSINRAKIRAIEGMFKLFDSMVASILLYACLA